MGLRRDTLFLPPSPYIEWTKYETLCKVLIELNVSIESPCYLRWFKCQYYRMFYTYYSTTPFLQSSPFLSITHSTKVPHTILCWINLRLRFWNMGKTDGNSVWCRRTNRLCVSRTDSQYGHTHELHHCANSSSISRMYLYSSSMPISFAASLYWSSHRQAFF